MKKLHACFAAVCALLFFVSLCLPAHAGQRITGCGFVDDDECFAEGQTTGSIWQGQHFAPGTTNLTYSIDFKGLEAYLQVNPAGYDLQRGKDADRKPGTAGV